MAIKQGEELSIHYTSPMLGTMARRSRVKKNWFFDCCCPRCRDPTELGTLLSALVCQACRREGRQGHLLPALPLDPACPWSCSEQGCSGGESAGSVLSLVTGLEAELEAASSSLEQLQEVLVSWQALLHPQHYLAMLGKRKLLAGLHLCPAQDQGREVLQQRVDLAEESLKVFGVLEPGYTLLMGRMLQYR